jgi:TonB family protein
MRRVLRILVVIDCLVASMGYAADDSRIVLVGVRVFRSHAVSLLLPEYPSSSLSRGHEGRAVAEVRVSKAGKVTRADVLEAPDQLIAAAVEAAVVRWSFRPFIEVGTKRPLVVQSRLIFYFKLASGKPLVVDAAATGVANP